MFYANNNWDINEGGETKFITNLQNSKKQITPRNKIFDIMCSQSFRKNVSMEKQSLHTATPI